MAIYIKPNTGETSQNQNEGFIPIQDFNPGQNLERPKIDNQDTEFDYNPDGSRTPKTPSVVDNYWAGNKPKTAEEIAAADKITKDDFAKRQQDSINAIDNMYLSIISRANQQGQNRLGSANTINALSGQRGSASGAANVDNVISANNADLKGIQAEKDAKVAEIMGKYTKDMQEELRYQNDLRQKNTDAWLSYMGSKESENKLNSKAMRADLLKSGVKIEEVSPEQLQKMAEAGGYSVDLFKSIYERERKQQEQASVDAELERLAKLENQQADTEYKKAQTKATGEQKPMEVSPGASIYDPATGKFLGTAPQKPADPANPKDNTITVGNSLLQYDSSTGTWKNIYTAPTDGKPLTVNEKLSLEEKGYKVGTNGELVKINVPTAEKVEKANNVISSINSLFATDDWKAGVGPVSSSLPKWMSGKRNTATANIDSIISSIALENLSLLKGPMSDKDIQFIKDASAGLRTDMDEEGFKTQLLKIKSKFEEIKKKAEAGNTGKTKEQLQQEFPQATPEELDALFKEESDFSSVSGDTDTATLKKVSKIDDGAKGGQCGKFVNKITGLGVGDTYESKISKMDPSITQPEPGMVFTMPYKDTGHTGIIIGIDGDNAIVKDSNYSLDGKIKTHTIPLAKMTGFVRV
jgi:hypothetical protein